MFEAELIEGLHSDVEEQVEGVDEQREVQLVGAEPDVDVGEGSSGEPRAR